MISPSERKEIVTTEWWNTHNNNNNNNNNNFEQQFPSCGPQVFRSKHPQMFDKAIGYLMPFAITDVRESELSTRFV
jgi:hypothetical protein